MSTAHERKRYIVDPNARRGASFGTAVVRMTVDDGRRLLISNLDLRRLETPPGVPSRAMAQNRAGELSDTGTTGNELRPYSLSLR